MNCKSQRRLGTAIVCAASFLGWSCSDQPHAAARHYKLSESVVKELEDAGFRAREEGQVLGALEMLFGTPAAPGYLVTNEWLDDGFNPNWPNYAVGDNGSGSVTDAEFAAIVEGNRQRFAGVIAEIEAGNFDGVEKALADIPRGNLLAKLWADLYASLGEEPSADDVAAFKDDAKLTFEEYYPSFADSAELYRQQCLHCHGNEGGADGPTARFLNPLPRDYRRGIFKYTALKDKARPRREDLFNTLAQGIYSTAMPNFRRFSDAELHGLVDYVQLLSMRGETEMLLAANMVSDEALTTDMVLETYNDVWGRWSGQDEKLITFDGPIPAPTPELLHRGAELFNDPNKGNCFSCHGQAGIDEHGHSWGGRGNGSAAFADVLDEATGEPVRSPWTGMIEKKATYSDDWGHTIVPRNLEEGVFRFGRRPIDIYRRIYAGINGTPMPAIGESKDAEGNPLLSDEDMWALVHFVRSLSEKHDGIGLLPQRLVARDDSASEHSEHSGHAPAEHGEESTH
ncbi:MAG: c-type cytochrome [Planctomycetes bacterium]|nr:c-type cytochrome [Planctomycetota bacterium]